SGTKVTLSQGVPMRHSTFTDPRIVAMLKEADAGRPVHEIWRHENSRLIRMHANLALENAAEGCDRKTALRPAERRAVVPHLVIQGDLPFPRACQASGSGALRTIGHWSNGPSRAKKRFPARVVQPLEGRLRPNVGWAVDFMSDPRYGEGRF